MFMVCSCLRNSEDLPGIDEVGVRNEIPVGFIDFPPLLSIAVLPLGDLREAVTLLHRVTAPGGTRSRRRAPAFYIRKVGLGPVTFSHHPSSLVSGCSTVWPNMVFRTARSCD